jgi:hypothetical protein
MSSIGDLQARRGLHDLAEHWYRRAAKAGHGRAALHVGLYLAMRDPEDPEVTAWYAMWKQNENGRSMRYQAAYVDPARMWVAINYTRREPGGDAMYIVNTPSMTYNF